MSTTDTRAAFEAMLVLYYPCAEMMAFKNSEGVPEYCNPVENLAWKMWQAATEAAKATGTAGELPSLPEEIEVGGEGWGWEDFQSEKTFSVEHMLHYGAACAQAAIAQAARQPAPVSVSERDMAIAQAVRQACVNSYSPDDSASDYTEKMGDIDLATVIRAATNRSQP